MNWEQIAVEFSVWVLPVLLAVTLHEAAHGWVAWKLGDDTAYSLGRVTFNPVRHIDPFGTVIMPALLLFMSGGKFMFGFAKPVPVNFMRLRKPRRDMIWVAAAGPGANIMIALACGALLHVIPVLPESFGRWLALNLSNAIWINALLAVFNMLPLPPLDGGRVAVGLLPVSLARPLAKLERYGLFIILGIVFLLPWIGGKLGVTLNVFEWLVVYPAAILSKAILTLTGVQ